MIKRDNSHEDRVPSISRRWLLGALAVLPVSCLPNLGPGGFRTMQSNGKPHAWQCASFVYAFADGNSLLWLKTLDKFEQEGCPLLVALQDGGHDMQLVLRDFDADGRASVTAYDLEMSITPREGGQAITLPGEPGTDEQVYDEAAAKAAEVTGIPAATIKQGHFSLYAIANGMTGLNAAHDSLKDIAFQKLLLREKLLRGEKQVDNFDPNRPKEESLSDLELALQLIEDEHIRISGQRAEILEMIAISQHFDAPGAIELLGESIGASREKTSAWRATHTRPTAEDYGVKAAALPSAASITEGINKELGFLGGLAKVAAGVVSANPGMALDGLSSLAPEDSSAQTSLRGLAAAVKGDLAGTIDAVAKLSGAEEAVDGVKDRLTRLESAVAFAKSRG